MHWRGRAHRVCKCKLEGGGVTLHPELRTLRGLREASGLELVWGCFSLGGRCMLGGGDAAEGEGEEGQC